MKSYFSPDGKQWTTDANDVARKLDKFLQDLYNEEVSKGYNFRELTSIALHSVSMAESSTAIKKDK